MPSTSTPHGDRQPDPLRPSGATSRDASAAAIEPTGIFAKRWVRVGVSLLLVYHLAAVLLEPLATPPNFAGPPSVIPEQVRPMFHGYTTALSLDHAYKFFAPNPGDSHLVRYDLYFADGTKRVNQPDQWFPDRKRNWPRLLYHRYFMITEFLPAGRGFDNWNYEPTARLAPPGMAMPPGMQMPPGTQPGMEPRMEMVPPPLEESAMGGPPTGTFDRPTEAGAGPEAQQPRREPLDQVYARGIAEHLARKHGAVRVDLFHVVHRLSHPEEIKEGRKLDAPDTYRERLLLSYQVSGTKPIEPAKHAKKDLGTASEVLR